MLHLGEVQNEGHTGDEDEIEEAHGGKEMSYLPKVGASQEHLKQHLNGKEMSVHLNQQLYKDFKSGINGSTFSLLCILTL